MTTTELTIRIVLSLLVVLAGLGIGLLIRRLLVRRLQKTVLDDWLIHLLGFVIVLPPLLIAVAASSGIATNSLDQLVTFWQQFQATSGVRETDLSSLAKNLAWTLLLIVVAVGVARTLSKLTMRGIGEHRLDLNLRLLINRVFYILVLLIAFFWILAIWQVAIVLPVTVLGALTIAVTFSVQDILKDLVAGIYLLVEHPFFIGDQISSSIYTGRVVAIELRATRMRLVSGEEVTVPNSLVFGAVVINNSRYSERRATVMVMLPLADFNRQETPERMIECVKGLKGVLASPEPTVTVSGITGEQVELTLRFWIATGQLATVTDVVYSLRTLLPGAGLSVKETAGDV